MAERDPKILGLDAEQDRTDGQCIIDINLTLAGMKRCLAIVDQTDLLWELGFYTEDERLQMRNNVVTKYHQLSGLNGDHQLYVTEPTGERLTALRNDLLLGLGTHLATYRSK